MSIESISPRLRRFAVTVDGVRHEVIVEELETADAPMAAPPTGDTPAGDGAAGTGNGLTADGWVLAPMPGTVTEIPLTVGTAVAPGDVLLILTAMKLENEIVAPAAGVIQAVAVEEGDTVNNGDRLIQLNTEEATP